jgi:hypothetical protein
MGGNMKNQNNTGLLEPKTYYDYENSNQTTMFVEPKSLDFKQTHDDSLIVPNSFFYLTKIEVTPQKIADDKWDSSFADSLDVLEDLADETNREFNQGKLETKGWDEL